MTLVACRSVTKVYGKGKNRRVALADCSFTANAGEIIGVVGPNGAGKTTLLRLIAGELPLTSGEVLVSGHRAGTRPARRAAGFAPDPPLAPPELSGAEWLTYLASHRARSPQERLRLVTWAVEFAELNAFVGRRIGTYSRGMAQRLALAAAAVCQGSVLLLDEVLSGVDPLVQRGLREQIARLAGRERTVLIASHDLTAIERLATRVLVLWSGRITADLSTAALVTQRVAELSLTGSALVGADRMLARYTGAVRTGQGVAVPLTGGLTIEHVLATAREERIAVAASRVRYRALEDILVAAAARHARHT
ncbi:MAG: ATP-binding cassette domain-containing protein [Gemmatimonadales bacterium]|nr:ATP-binding cassette domain-containing protein [Gemmatimonadales bacterium]NIN48641.1 ATP-binding cassette domain-containing protein [Gemmatimonadales bacterium]NIP06105.1 ATP-binding cassette domain-containing protein [Gemmatimonadales bacterium]NIR01279.1 ATP-binding cassette domain-containing protein [Gemmatimonadales bacterium]